MQRLPIALHIPQEGLPLSGTSGNRTSVSEQVPTGAGYGPQMPSEGTPLAQLVNRTLYTQEEMEDGEPGLVKTEYDQVCIPLTNRNWQERWERMCTIAASESMNDIGAATQYEMDEKTRKEAETWRGLGGFSRTEVNLTRSEESANVTVFASDWLELDSPVEGIRFDSELALRQEVAYASYLSISTIIIPPPRSENREFLEDYARAISNALGISWHMNIAIRIPVTYDMLSSRAVGPGSQAAPIDQYESWDAWNTIHRLCNYSVRLSVMLDLTNPLPPAINLMRWAAEPLKFLYLPCTTFIPNAKGYPVLSKNMQAFMRAILRFSPTVVLSGPYRGLHTTGGPNAYPQYLRFLQRRGHVPTPLENYAKGYLDHLQAPLQPLMDNLEGETYEGFERDPIKYRQYEEAVCHALMDRPQTSSPIIIFVVGAGRGPLVAGCLRAAERAHRRVKITAVEKNQHAYVILQERAALEWGNTVDIVFGDMRSFAPKERADIIVSELLGSFGDNELSPECLDGVMRCLKPDGVSIPQSYVSYLAPITSSKLHSSVIHGASALVPGAGTGPTAANENAAAEQPYVVMLAAHHILSEAGGRLGSDRVQECWSFCHPRPDVLVDERGLPLTNHHNARAAHLTFHIPRAGVCHGFAGYFEAVLYGDIGLSTHPERSSGDMLSWFPIFFPLAEPVYLPPNAELDLAIWRISDETKKRVWIEWAASAYLPLAPQSILSLQQQQPPNGSSSTLHHAPNSATGSSNDHRSNDYRSVSPWDQSAARSSVASSTGSAVASAVSHQPSSSSMSGAYRQGNLSPMIDAFQPAPSPMIVQSSQMSDDMNGAFAVPERIKISMTKLHNSQGGTYWIGL